MHAGETAPSDEVSSLLGLSPGETAIVRRRVIELDDQPCELTDSYYPASIARGTRLAEKRKIPGGAVSLLAALGHVGTRVREDVTARMPDSDEREILHLYASGLPLRVSRPYGPQSQP